jgi:probable phosphoglycerate mutase
MPPEPSVLLIRHAQSIWNAEARWQGQADPPLSDDGDAQIEVASRGLSRTAPFDLIITSDLKRARATAERIAGFMGVSPPHLLEPGLREYDVGQWSGLTRAEIERRWPSELTAFDAGRLSRPPGGESRSGFDERVRSAFELVSAVVMSRDVRHALVVTHGGVIRSLARTSAIAEIPIGHLAGYRARAREGGLDLIEPVRLLPDRADVAEPADLEGEQEGL